MEKWQRINTILLGVISICLIVIVVQLILLPPQLLKTDPDNMQSTVETEASVQTNEIAMEEIETPYCTLKYPADLYEYLKIDEKSVNDVEINTFYAVIDDEYIELFTVYFGDDEKGESLGFIAKDGMDVPVSISVSEIIKSDSWTDEKFDRICTMQEAVNDVIQSITTDDNYIEN